MSTPNTSAYAHVGPFTPQPTTLTTAGASNGDYVDMLFAIGMPVSCNLQGCTGNCGICTPRTETTCPDCSRDVCVCQGEPERIVTAPTTWPCRQCGAKRTAGDGHVCQVGAIAKPDPVNRPAHYTAGKVEAIDAIESALGASFADYCRGQVIKYVWRAGLKSDALEDARKAAWYLNRMIATMEEE